MSLKLRQYNHLRTHQKAILVCTDSVLLDIELSKDVIHSLYSYSSYYIEVRVDNYSKKLIDIIAFRNGKKLDKYLNKINLLQMIGD